MFTGLFLKDTVERVLVTFAEALLAMFLVAPHTSVIAFDWPSALGVAATAAVISFLKAVIASRVSSTVSPASLATDDRGV